MLKKTLTILVALMLVTACVVAMPVSTSAKHVVEEELLVYDSPQSYKELLADYVDLEEFENYLQPLLAQCEAQIDLGKYDLPNDQEVLNAVARYITYFMPDAFHFHTASFTSLVGKVKTMTVQYAEFADEPAEYAACKEEFVQVVNKMTADLLEAEALTDAEIALLLHDRLAVWNEYDEANYLAGSVPTVSFTAYGALVNRTSVCQGYALAYEYLLDMFDIKSEVCSSKLLNHAWNIVYIDDKAYHVDVTWDDPTTDTYGRVLHTNFLRSAKGIASTGHKGESGQIDYDTSATDTTYDNAYWQNSNAEFQLLGGKLYYVDNKAGAIKCTDGTTLITIEDKWMSSANGYYPGNFTYLSRYEGLLLYNAPLAVYKLDVSTKKAEKVYLPEKPAYYNIYGFTYRDGKIHCDISNTPNMTAEIKAKYSEATTCHFFDNACDAKCNLCGETRTVAGHKYDNACDKTCNVCGATRTVAGHKYDNDCDKTCNVCSATRTVAGHKYDNACDKTCNVCKATRTTSHSYQKVVTKATLSANGKIVNKCKVCGYTASTTTTIYRPTSFKLSATSYTYNGAVKTPTVTVKDSAGKTISSSNYTVTYASGRKNAGTYTVKVTMKGNYSGTKTLSFKINPIDISKCSVKLSATSYTYNGAVKTPTVTVKNASGTKLSTASYTATYSSGRKNVGTYKVTVKMKGNYTGTKALTFKINPINISKCKLSLSATTYTYDGKVKKPTVTVKNASGTKLSTASYTATYASGRKNVGTYKVTVKMKGNYTGTKTLTFKINPAKTTVSKVTPATKSLKVAITKKSTQVTGYQVQYSTSKSFKSYKTVNISSYKTTSTTIKSLKAKTTYYVRVRTYKTVSGTKYYSGWSTVKYAKTK